jgi:predicted regulator of Ras-like GTPase activity (Roadblock/LC7/MglB family)
MLEPILQSLRDVEGVQGALIIDPAALVVAHNAHAIYDTAVLQQVARAVINSVDSIQLVQDDWDMLSAHFGDGQLVLRSLRPVGDRPRRYVLAVIADASLNVAFLGVALRVASGKLVTVLETTPAVGSTLPPPPAIAGGTGRVPKSDLSGPELARSGLSWSGSGDTGVRSVGSGSGVGNSEVTVTDPSSQAFLSACTRALAVSVGPMAKVFVKEAVREVCGDRPFAPPDGPALIAQLARVIDDPEDRAAFVRATRVM